MAKIKKILKIAGIALLLVIAIPLLIGQILRMTANVEPPPGKLVDVGGYKLHINCLAAPDKIADELPTVIFEAGAGVSSPVNHWIQAGVSKTTKICVYDRAGLGWSEESGLPRDAGTINTALHTLLDRSGIKRPFVFAGHSIAGLYMRDYIERYPDDVAGLVFLDASHPEQNERLGLSRQQRDELIAAYGKQILIAKIMIGLGVMEVYNPIVGGNEDLSSFPEKIRNQLVYLSKRSSNLDTVLVENNDFEKAAAQAARNKTLGERPVVVISATKPIPPGVLPADISAEKFQKAFVDLHREIKALSSDSKHIEIGTADHMSLITGKDNAARVVPHIISVVRAAKKTEKTETDPASEKQAQVIN